VFFCSLSGKRTSYLDRIGFAQSIFYFFFLYKDQFSVKASMTYDLKNVISSNRLVGLWRMMTGFRISYFGATISIGIAALSKTATFLLIRYLVDQVLGSDSQGLTLIFVASGFVGLAFVEGSFSFLSGRLASRTAEGVTRRLRNYLYDHIQRLSFTYHAQTSTGDLIERATSDVETLRKFYSDQAINIGRVLLLFIINFAVLATLNLSLALFSIIIIPFLVIISYLFFKKISKSYEAYQEQEAALTTTLQENLSGVRVVKAFARQHFEMNKFDQENLEKLKRGIHLSRLHSIFWPSSDILCALQMLGGFLMGALMAINGTITVGTYIAYAGLVTWIIFPMRSLGRLISQMSTALVSFNRVTEIIKQEREPLHECDFIASKKISGDFLFDHVSFEYEAGIPVLHDINFHCKPGQVIGLIGSTGSGKTSLVNLLPRFYEVTGGKILLDGVDLRKYSRQFLRQQIGIVEQEPFLFSRSILENITYGISKEVDREEIEEAARAASIHEVILSFPQGYETMVGEKGVTLSGGQKQRVAITRTILKNPGILILDDSTSSVDTETEFTIRQALQFLMKDRTTFIIAHRIQSITNADLILVFDQGRVIQQGVHSELISQDGMYRRIFNIQTQIEVELEKEISSVSIL
jgi:ATP-binding cassette, subfamily B, bacterial